MIVLLLMSNKLSRNRRDQTQFSRRSTLAAGIGIVGFAGGVTAPVQAQEDDPGETDSIEDWTDLDEIRDDPAGEYALTTGLDRGTDGYEEAVRQPEGGFEPIDEFTGTFDGQGNEIRDLVINRPERTGVGLFGQTVDVFEETDTGPEITNIRLIDADVTGGDRVGGLVGFLKQGTVERVAVTGTVAGVTSEDTRVGGLVGQGVEVSIRQSIATADVAGRTKLGGIIGDNDSGQVTQSYATGAVSGSESVGGLVGINAADATVSETFATGTVTGDSGSGGLVGRVFNGGGSVDSSYWDASDSGTGQDSSAVLDNDFGLETDEMQGTRAEQNMSALDFETTWDVVTDPDGYPVLRWQESDSVETAGQASVEFIRETAPTAGQTLSEFTSPEGLRGPQVRVENPPVEADDVSLRDAETGQEIRSVAPDQLIEGTVVLNSVGSTAILLEDERQDAKADIEERIQESVVLELTESLDAEADLREVGELFVLRDPSGAGKVAFVGGADVELVFLDDDGDRIDEGSRRITIGESTASQEEPTEPQGEITFTDQRSDGESVRIDEIVLGETVDQTAGFIEDSDGNTVAGAGQSSLDVTESVTDLEVVLADPITESQELTVRLFESGGSLLDEDSASISVNQEPRDQETETASPESNQSTTETPAGTNATTSTSAESADVSERDLIIPGDGLASTDVDNRVIITAVSAALSFFSMGYTFFSGDDD